MTPGTRLSDFFDWDTAGPSTREIDLAFSALSWVPLYTPAAARQLGFSDPGDLEQSAAEVRVLPAGFWAR